MPGCTRPLRAVKGPNGLVFNVPGGSSAVEVPCGQCGQCRIRRKLDWAVRTYHETVMATKRECPTPEVCGVGAPYCVHRGSSFLTLTWNEQFAPADGSLSKRPLQLFLKRLRFEVGPVRYLACGEYGPKLMRPHYHLCLIGWDFSDDRYAWGSAKPNQLYRSPRLERLWSDPKTGESYGFSTIGNVSFQSAEYVAGYTVKKITGKRAAEYYRRPHPVTGEPVELEPEFALMSRRPGLGAGFLNAFRGDVFPDDEVRLPDGRVRGAPAYYRNLFKRDFPSWAEALAGDRRVKAEELRAQHPEAFTPEARKREEDRLARAHVKASRTPRFRA